MAFDGFILDHQSSDKPIRRKGTIANDFKLHLNKTSELTNDWLTIKYTEKKVFSKRIQMIAVGILNHLQSILMMNKGKFFYQMKKLL